MAQQNLKTRRERLNAFYSLLRAKCKETSCDACLSNVRFDKSRLRWKCNKKGCNKTKSLLQSNVMFNRKVSIEVILDLIFYLTNNMSSKNISIVLNISKETIKRYKHKLKKLMRTILKENRKKLGGEGVVVEVDESKFGHRKYNRGRVVDGVWVLGMVEKSLQRRVIMLPIENKSAKTLRRKIKKYVKKGTIIHSDCWKGYCGLENHGYTHKVVNHKMNYVDPLTGCHTNTIEGNWNGVKCGIPKKHYNKKGIRFYLYLYMLKRNLCEDVFLIIIKNL